VVVVLLGSANKARTEALAGQEPFAAAPGPSAPTAPAALAPASPAVASVAGNQASATGKKPEQTAVWGPPLASLASLNEVAVDKDAVFIFLPAKGGKQTGAIREQVEAAAKKAQSRGSAVAAYTLTSEAEDYTQVTGQVPAPCVLVMVKGAGAAPVTGEITEAKLLEALVAASRPSSCGPSGCGPSGCG